MSVGAGRLRGRRLAVAEGSRPSSGRIRAALFSIWGERLAGAELLDLFAGSGGVGIEAWSRGARAVTLVENGQRALAVIRRNADLVAEAGAARVLALPVERALERLAAEGRLFDLVFADPPYELRLGERFFRLARRVAGRGTSLAIEHRASTPPADETPGWSLRASRRHGDSTLRFYEPDGEGSAV
ncbi:MAG TPA: 16S rRNA (guanine(966)-N(2))-methyltransferase RsmD [Thermoanaerobaculia bacterium]